VTILEGIVLGLVQGLTEFLPISSSGHLVLVPHILGWKIPSVTFDVFVHLGTLTAVISYFWLDLRDLFRSSRRIIGLIIVATVPAALFGYFFEGFFESLFGKPTVVSFLLLITGLVLWSTEGLTLPRRKMGEIGLTDSLIVGFAQAVAIAPGISRSGMTIAAGMIKGFEREAAARFSFLMFIPVIILAAIFEKIRDGAFDYSDFNLGLVLGFAAAAISGYFSIKYLLKYLKQGNLKIFAYYCWIFGGFTLVLSYFK